MSEDAKCLSSYLEAEFGEYRLRQPIPGKEKPDNVRLWKVSEIDMLLTKHKLSEEEIAAEYRERMVLMEMYWRSKAKALTATVRQQFGRANDWTEQKVFETVKYGTFTDDSIVTMYRASMNAQSRS